MNVTFPGLILGLCCSAGALAAPMLKQDLETTRVTHVNYTPNNVTRVLGAIDHPVLIEFSAAEAIEDVAGGGISGWEIQKRGHRLFVRAMAGASEATMLVTTRARSYVFDLVPLRPSAKGNLNRRMSKVVFDDDTPTVPAPTSAAGTAAVPVEPVTASLDSMRLDYPNRHPYRNANYTMQVVSETVDIRPREAFDDGRFTWLLFPRNQEVPAVYKSVPGTEEEVVVNSHMEGDWLVLHAVAPMWNLRLAGSMIGVFNDAYDAMGVGGGTKTVFPNVMRVDKQ
ncbi:MAG: TrbG/VirB9 family P-type conjugative transfer protein [Burkholderiales bacterium]|nr:TrbG/VirB9 family P-type conjugative transfer protein [Burkholderiales bacterium]